LGEAASSSGATVLQHDHEYERIAAVTGLRQSWVVPAGLI